MDEVLAVWVVRLHSVHDVISALYHGAEFSPPTYHLLLYTLTHMFGSDSYRLLRLPSILATLGSGLCVFALIRRYFGIHAAGFGLAFSLLGFWSSYALEIRPYALVVACFASAVVLWDSLDEQRQYLWRVSLMSACLAGAASLHFYAVLFVVCFITMEVFWSYHHCRLRFPVWLGLLAAGGSSLLWLPLIKALSRYNSGDTSSTQYYARPILNRVLDTYVVLSVFEKRQVLFFTATVCLVAAVYAWNKIYWQGETALELTPSRERASAVNFYIIAFSAIAFPLLVYLFAVVVTKTYNTRYALVAGLGFALLTASLMNRVPALRLAAAPILMTACALAFIRPGPAGAYVNLWEANAVLAHATKSYPIVVSEGLDYFQLKEGLPAPLSSRLVYVTVPAGVVSPDPTNENQVKRWIPLRPDLKIVNAETFLAQNPHFYLLHTTDPTALLTGWLLREGMIEKIIAYSGGTWLFEVGSGR